MRKQYFSFIFLYIFSSCLYSQTMDDNIIINCCEDSYVLQRRTRRQPHRNKTPVKTEYRSLADGSYRTTSYVLWPNYISLDEAKAKGVLAPKAIHRHATPENVLLRRYPYTATSTSP